MKFKIKEFTRENTTLSQLILTSITESAMATVPKEDRKADTEVDVELKFNGVEIDITKFITRLEESWDNAIKRASITEAREIFEEMKHDFKSKNSANAQLSKINEQIQKANNQLKNISENINQLDV